MSKKAIIAGIAVLSLLAVAVAVSVFFLYSGTGVKQVSSLASDSETGLLSAVPSDAVAVAEFEDLKTACRMIADSAGCLHYFLGNVAGGQMEAFLKKASGQGLGSLKSSGAVMSLHYNGSLVPLLVVDAGRAGSSISDDDKAFMDCASSFGLSAISIDGQESGAEKNYISRRRLLAVSYSDVFVKSSERHMSKGISILDSDGFASCAGSTGAGNRFFVSSSQIGKLFTGLMQKSTYGFADFLKKYADWTAFSVEDNETSRLILTGRSSYEDGIEDFINVFGKYSPAKSQVTSVLPYYTAFFATLPVSDIKACTGALDTFWDASGRLDKMQSQRHGLRKKTGIDPLQWALSLDIGEMALAAFRADGVMESVLLVKLGNCDLKTVFKDFDKVPGRKASLKICANPYTGFASTVFGPYFSLADESCYTLVDGWAVIGSRNAISEYAEGRALANSLSEYMSDSSVQSLLSAKEQYFVTYTSVSDAAGEYKNFMKPSYASSFEALASGFNYVPVLFSISRDKAGIYAGLAAGRVNVTKSKAPVYERDTTVVVSKGPFKVKNSGTGEMNLFYQQDNNYLCLKTTGGKGLWAVPFSAPICGNAGTVDYFANGKLQILFASGSSLYLIDRLGRYVSPFPVKLGKEVLLGPGIYDFNKSRKYNVLVLHKDNTIEMYNLQGKKPAQWKTITAKETIKGLPELIKAGGRSYWVVRTSIQTLIYGFYGGEPITVFSGDKMIRPDSKVTPGDGASVSVVCYDGKTHTIKLK